MSLAESLFTPRSIAVYGASARDPAKLGNTLLRNVASGDAEVVAVNPLGGTIEGRSAVPALDRPVDLALISVPTPAVAAAITDAAAAGARAAVVLSSGFGETGDAGRAAEREIAGIAAAAGMRLIGPNCMGVVSARRDDGFLNGSYFWAVADRTGPLSFISQSGAVGGLFFSECRSRGLGACRFVSVGNAVDVNETDVLDALATDDATGAVGLFVEGFRDGRRFVEVARRVTETKPVVALKAGKAAAGARAAASHTGSLAGTHGPVTAAFARAGVIEAGTTDELFDVLAGLVSLPAGRGRRVAIVTISGGPSVLAADAAERAKLELPAPGEETAATIRRLAPSFAAVGNPFDLTPQCSATSFVPAIRAVYDDERYDGVVAINCGLDVPEFGEGVARAARDTGKPTTAFVLDVPAVRAALAAAEIPCFASPERAVIGYAAGCAR